MTEGMLKMMGVFAEMERNMISKRVKLGMENAKAKGKEVGRPKITEETISDDFMKYYKMYKEKKINKTELQLLTKLSRSTVHRYCKKLEGK
jgi:DNA invertase Pin-like site-specific DNA recombinase